MKRFWIALAVLVAVFRVVLLFTSFNHHIEQTYQALAHGLVFGLLGWWLCLIHEDIEAEGFSWWQIVPLTILTILFSPVMVYSSDDGDWASDEPTIWPIFTVTALTWVEIVCFRLSRIL